MLEEASDEELFERYRRGERGAFEVLLRRHRGPLFNFVLRFTGADRERAEDVVQDAFVRVLRGGEFDRRSRFSTWLYTIARNLCLDLVRRDRFRKGESLDAPLRRQEMTGATLGDRVASPAPRPDRAAAAARLRPALEEALRRLPDDQREVFVLREYSGVPFKEIAERTGTNENTVKSRMRYALESMRRTLAELGVDGDLADEVEVRRGVG